MIRLDRRRLGAICRTGAFVLLEALTASAALAFASIPGNLPLVWPAAGIGALWGLLIRSRIEALVASASVALILRTCATAFGYTGATGLSFALVNLSLLLVPRLFLDAVRRRPAFRTVPGREPWVIQRASHAAWFVTAGFVASTVAIPFAHMALSTEGFSFDINDAVAHFVRNMAAIVLIAGTWVAMLNHHEDDPIPSPTFIASTLVFPLAVAVLVFHPAVHSSLLMAMLLPLFWSAVRLPQVGAMAHSVYVLGVVLVGASIFGSDFTGIALSPQGLATRIQLFAFIAGTLSLVVSAGVSRVRELNRDIRAAERRAREETERLAAVAATVPDGLAIVDRAWRVEQLNESSPGFLQRDTSGRYVLPEHLYTPEGVIIPDEERPAVIAFDGAGIRDLPVAVEAARAGRRVFELSSIPLDDDPEGSILLSFKDATERFEAHEERKRAAAELAYQARHDALTGLRNRQGFKEDLDALVDHYAQTGEECAVLVLDLDLFKNVNDTLGHAVGDLLLIEVARVLETISEPGDVVARLGGDEFAILLSNVDVHDARWIGEAVVSAIEAVTDGAKGQLRRVTASVGVVTLSAASRLGIKPMELADMLVYEAKADGRNSLRMLDEDNPQLPARGRQMALAQRIHEAMRADRLALHLQAIIDARSGALVSAETLLRFEDGGEPVSSAEFVAAIEQNGFAVSVDEWVLKKVIELRKRLDEFAPNVRLSFNVSGASIGRQAFRAAVEEAFGGGGRCDPSTLILEITETAAISDIDAAAEFTRWARSLGLRVALDDFGAGYAPFTYVKRLAFDYVKIDGSFVADADINPTDRAIVIAILELSHDLGKRTIAEYVADESDMRLMRILGADYLQGYAIGRALPFEDFLRDYVLSARGPLGVCAERPRGEEGGDRHEG